MSTEHRTAPTTEPVDMPRPRSLSRRAAGSVLAIGVVALIAVGCGSSGSKSTTGNPTSSTAPGGATSGTGTQVTATLTEYHIALSDSNLKAGTYTFRAVNSGHTVHALEITGPGLQGPHTGDLQPGQSADLTVTLQSGTYDVFCPIPGHQQLGMNLNLNVAGGASGSSATAAPASATSASGGTRS